MDSTVDDQTHRHPLDAYVPDPRDIPPLCDEERFAALLRGIVADTAPRMFAIVQEYGTRVDARVAGWGMAFEDGRTEVVSTDGTLRGGGASPEQSLRGFGGGTHIRPRLVWYDPEAVTPELPLGD